MSSNSDFVIQYRILEKYNGPGGDVSLGQSKILCKLHLGCK